MSDEAGSNTVEGGASVQLSSANPEVRILLREWLLSADNVRVTEEAAKPASGEQGTLSYILVTGGVSAVVAAIRVLPDFIRSMRESITVTVTKRDGKSTTTIELKAENTKEIPALIKRVTTEIRGDEGRQIDE
jgi:Effector Associated Constant Component 1